MTHINNIRLSLYWLHYSAKNVRLDLMKERQYSNWEYLRNRLRFSASLLQPLN